MRFVSRWAELFEVAVVAISANHARRTVAPAKVVASFRARGARRSRRDSQRREHLRRTIRFVDRLFLSGPNCYRRTLTEIALDAGAAAEPLRMGLQAHGAPRSGHIWLASAPDGAGSYDAELVL
jgi:hypothetical protein